MKSCCAWRRRDSSAFCRSPQFVATFGGGEANVAVALASFGLPARYVTVLPPANPIADAVVARAAPLRRGYLADRARQGPHGRLLRGDRRQPAASKVVYDRDYSSIALAKPGDIDWDAAFEGAGWFHITGITPAISASAADLALESVRAGAGQGPHRFLRSQLSQEPVEVGQARGRSDARAGAIRRHRHRQ